MRIRTFRGVFTAAILCVTAIGAAAAERPDGEAILAKADAFRLFAENGFSYDFWTEDSSGEVSVMRVSVRLDGAEAALVRYLEPVGHRGRSVLVRGNTFWFFEPGMKSALRISPRQILFGQASAGDVSRINYRTMYGVDRVAEEDGKIVLALTAKAGAGATYDAVDLVTDADWRPLEARCRGKSGTLMKTIRYEKYETIGGKLLLTEFSLFDEIRKEKQRVRLSRYSVDVPPVSAFSVQALRRAP
jgi:outer membrane lipoprotein-sorting protein